MQTMTYEEGGCPACKFWLWDGYKLEGRYFIKGCFDGSKYVEYDHLKEGKRGGRKLYYPPTHQG